MMGKRKGAHLLTPRHWHWYAITGTLSMHPLSGRTSSAVLCLEITSFVADSSRSYADLFKLARTIGQSERILQGSGAGRIQGNKVYKSLWKLFLPHLV